MYLYYNNLITKENSSEFTDILNNIRIIKNNKTDFIQL